MFNRFSARLWRMMARCYRAFDRRFLASVQAGADFNDLNPQPVDVHTILPRIPAMKIGMNAMGHKMLHVHSDDRGEQDRYSSEILSSGLTAGFSLTDRVKGMQKGDGKPGAQWLMYSLSQMFRLKDEGTGDILTVKDG